MHLVNCSLEKKIRLVACFFFREKPNKCLQNQIFSRIVLIVSKIVSIRGKRLTPRYPPVPEQIRIRAGHRITALSAGGGGQGVVIPIDIHRGRDTSTANNEFIGAQTQIPGKPVRGKIQVDRESEFRMRNAEFASRHSRRNVPRSLNYRLVSPHKGRKTRLSYTCYGITPISFFFFLGIIIYYYRSLSENFTFRIIILFHVYTDPFKTGINFFLEAVFLSSVGEIGGIGSAQNRDSNVINRDSRSAWDAFHD